jgi:isoleucyl-tRNA synthetase
MASVQAVVSAAHALRKEHKLKVRQPLAKAHVICADENTLESLRRQTQLIAEELNVKEVEFHQDETEFVALIAKPNFRVLGKKVGKLMTAVQKAIAGFDQTQLKVLMSGRNIEIRLEGEMIVLTPEDVSVERKVHEGTIALTVQDITVALDTVLNEELLLEGLARELVNKVNTMRREQGYAVTDRIVIQIQTSDRVKEAFNLHRQYICHEVLAEEVHFDRSGDTEWDLNGEQASISLLKI